MLKVHTDGLPAGEPGTVRISWDGATGTELAFRLGWTTTGKARAQSDVVVTRTVAVSDAAGEVEIALDVPQSPWSYRGALFSVVWTATVELQGAGSVEHPIAIGPAGQEALPAAPRQ